MLVANLDQALLVFACTNPEFHTRMLDRYLVLTEASELETVIVANKVDLVGAAHAREQFAIYERIGYPVIYTSTKQGLGIDELRARLRGRVSVVTGKSGVGKSSLLNVVQPNLGLATSDVSELLGKGRHTTTVAELIALDHLGGGYVADTPGIREFGLWNLTADTLRDYFPEFAEPGEYCRFNDCTHLHEPGCAVKERAEAGELNQARYDAYVRLAEDLSQPGR